MSYVDRCRELKLAFERGESEFDNMEFKEYQFHSSAHDILPGKINYQCESHELELTENLFTQNDIGEIQDDVHMHDVVIEENRNFSYNILKPKGKEKLKKLSFIFHGFNEKTWDKYLPWGQAICEKTQSAVIFFPIAFHMQRAPKHWSDKKAMFELSKKRKAQFPNIIGSSLSNVAISMRLHSKPQRFIWSGLQTYYDIIQFIEECKSGKHELIDKNFSFDIFAYSIGGFLAEILKLTNYKNYFSDTKLCLFCSGAVFNRLSPVSKFILDSEVNVALYSYLVEHFSSFLKKDNLLHHYLEEDHLEGKVFHTMLEYKSMRNFREDLFRKVENQIYAIALKGDSVFPTYEIENTLKGASRDINIVVEELDFGYSYTHENPFPMNKSTSGDIEESIDLVFTKVCDFFNRK
ncbi:hypothetical protein BZG02_14175 [Labilibaculum filiforme]|uniref:Alpha/beta hydrolase n=1 Tax=Labilibaculum filiforme TaxID=1940526 RepID=A0A2N3HVL3_9BACT|nr:DUF6051 family protein [Labilibaculum filiforme]PKQ62073.1 hypothetical protein BZG02_14175 [Labilibaculum filiforme]